MSDMMPPSYSERSDYLRPQANYPMQPAPYGSPQPQAPGYGYPPSVQQPQQPYAYPPVNPYNPYPAPPPQPPQPINVIINNAQTNANVANAGYVPVIMGPYDPYAGAASTTLALGLWAILVWIIPLIGTLASLICAIVGLFTAIRGCKSVTRRGSAITGLVLCIVTLMLFTAGFIIFSSTILTIMGSHPPTAHP